MDWGYILAAVLLGLALIGMVCISFVERNQGAVEDDQFTPELPWIPEEMSDFARAQAKRQQAQRDLRNAPKTPTDVQIVALSNGEAVSL